MAGLIKVKGKKYWETITYGAFQNTKAQLRNIIIAINRSANAIKMRCRRDKNLSDIYDAASGRINLELINDCSALTRSPHHHDSRYIPLINAETAARKAEDQRLWAKIQELRRRIEAEKKRREEANKKIREFNDKIKES